jgi:hypothetical protein
MLEYRNLEPKLRTILIRFICLAVISTIPLSYFFSAVNGLEFDSGSAASENSVVGFIQRYVSIIAGIAEVGVVFLLYKTVKDFSELAKVSRLQTEVRFRPWIGPSGNITKLGHDIEGDKFQYAIALKNFGEVPSPSVTATSVLSNVLPTRQSLNGDNVNKFNLGPLLPNMEKKYWIFLDGNMISNAKNGKSEIYVALYFSYLNGGASNGYGMISQYDSKNDSFIHKEMWLD